MKCLLYAVLILFSFIDCGRKEIVPTTPAPPIITVPIITPTDTIRFLALGDSYTIGESVTMNERFPTQTAKWLNDRDRPVSEVIFLAETGWTTFDLDKALSISRPKGVFDIVTLLIGANDQYQGLDTAGYRSRFIQLLQTAIELADNLRTHVVVVSIPDYGATPFGKANEKRIAKEIDMFNAINREVALRSKVPYADITHISREPDPALVATDDLHPSGKQYKKWAELIGRMIMLR